MPGGIWGSPSIPLPSVARGAYSLLASGSTYTSYDPSGVAVASSSDASVAIAAAIAVGGLRIIAGTGTFTFATQLNVNTSNVSIEGQGPNQTTFVLANNVNGNVIRFNHTGDITGATRISGCSLRNLTLDGNGANQSAPSVPGAFVAFAVDYFTAENITITNSLAVGCDVIACDNPILDNVRVLSVVAGGAQNGIQVRNSAGITYSGSYGDALLKGCHVEGADNNAFFVAVESRRVSVVNCNARGTTAATSWGIMCEAGVLAGQELVIDGCVVEGCPGVGIGMTNSSPNAVPYGTRMAFTGNTVTNCGFGLSMGDGYQTATGNTITDCETGIKLGRLSDYTEEDFTISDNTIILRAFATGNGIIAQKSVAAGTKYLRRLVIANNTIVSDSLPPPPTPSVTTTAGSVDVGTHVYAVSYYDSGNNRETVPSELSAVATVAVSGKQVTVYNIPLAPSRGAAAAGLVWQRRLYRSAAGTTTLQLLTTLADNTTTSYTDNTADAGLGAAPKTVSDIVSSRGIVLQSRVRDAQISDNLVGYFGLSGIKLLAGDGATPNEVAIETNRCFDNGQRASANSQSGISIDAAADKVRISGDNRCYDQGSTKQKYGLDILGTVTNVSIGSNDFGGNNTQDIRNASLTGVTWVGLSKRLTQQGELAETFPFWGAQGATAIQNQQMEVGLVFLYGGMVVQNLSVAVSAAGATPANLSHAFLALYKTDGTLLARSADDSGAGSAFQTPGTVTKAIAFDGSGSAISSYQIPADGAYYLALLMQQSAGGGIPTIVRGWAGQTNSVWNGAVGSGSPAVTKHNAAVSAPPSPAVFSTGGTPNAAVTAWWLVAS